MRMKVFKSRRKLNSLLESFKCGEANIRAREISSVRGETVIDCHENENTYKFDYSSREFTRTP